MLIATQVVEASLDLVFDVMVSDLARIGALIQGAGRLWRHMDVRPASTRPSPSPELKIVSPDPSQVETGRCLHSALNKGAWVYPQDLQWRTARAVFDTGAIQAPDGLRALIEAVHGYGAPDVPEALGAAETERLGQMFGERTQAQSLLMKPEDGYLAGAQRIYDEDRLSTRLGAPQVTLRLARPGSEGLEPFQDSPEILDLKARWKAWEQDAVILAMVGATGRISDNLSYDAVFGLRFLTPGN